LKKLLIPLLMFILLFSGCGNKLISKVDTNSLPLPPNASDNLSITIDSKLDIICNNPKVAMSSNPYDYTKNSKDYTDIVNLGDNALRYMLTKLKTSKENGLKQYVMAIACSEILKENPESKKWSSGSEWYTNHIKSN
jgi:hypothetical protein